MKAAIVTRYGPPHEVIRIVDLPTPTPGPGEILIRTVATTVSSGDARMRALRVPAGMSLMVRLTNGWSKPRRNVLGLDLAGPIEAVGPGVTAFAPGDRVVAAPNFALGGHAEYRVLPETAAIVRLPDAMGYDEAVALVFGGLTARYFLAAGGLQPGQSILINGASGAVGTMAVQMARHIGAKVTAVTSAANADLVRALGADQVVDYATTDFTTIAQSWDVIMDTIGNAPFARSRRVLAPDGKFLQVIGNLWEMIAANFQKQVVSQAAPDAEVWSPEALRAIVALAEQGAIRAVIDRRYPLERIAEAHEYVDTGRKRGAVVVGV